MAPPNADLSHSSNAAASNGSVPSPLFKVNSPNVQYTDEYILSKYSYFNTLVTKQADGTMIAEPTETVYEFKTERTVPRVGMMMVGWGGNNGSTLTASILAHKNKLTWRTKSGVHKPNYFGSVTQSSTVRLGVDAEGADVHVPLSQMLPMVNPTDFVLGGWDISSKNLAESMDRAKVLAYDLQRQVADEMSKMTPLPSIYYPDFIAANQEDRADNLIPGNDKRAHVNHIRKDIRDFKAANNLDKVIVIWTANTERFAELIDGVNDTADNFLAAVENSHEEVAPSSIFALACIEEGTPFINGSPQNTFVPGLIQLAERHKAFIGGDDFKSGQTKMKSALVDFLVNAGIKPVAITSYNHLGNNDGKNLSSHRQFRSKEISKSTVVDDMVAANDLLYAKDEHPDHTVVIKYVPSVGDSKRALDEYECDIFMGGRQSISMYNICEDSLLASPLIIDLVIMTELMTRLQYKTIDMPKFSSFHSVLSILSYMLKAPMVSPGTPVVNALSRQRTAIENIFRAAVGLSANNEMGLEHKVW
ncbi:myo-inositol-1-phosphate synthase [Mucor circinelloides 1006PhL]|uniref:inositol-3-phosphate synthase n=1 Tax=Mucor circinelloides f. circinelloides (strain 1006PhL) TaxID=1220926 RepID=S2JV45_MUCC1|nr:myo-inositol-1-phosphate synthase [Mucor circinelloides 1006PhL]